MGRWESASAWSVWTAAIRAVWLAFACLMALCTAALTDDYADGRKKIALVIALKDYRFTAPLVNTVSDAKLIAGKLKDAGFAIHEAYDSELDDLKQAIDGFLTAATGADVALVYYTGHGLQIDGLNYIVPVEFNDRRSDPLDGLYPISTLLGALGDKVKARAIILDACRNNPFLASIARNLNRKGLSRGLAPIELPVIDAARAGGNDGAHGLLVGYATQPFDVADDGAGGISPYAEALRDALANADEDLNSILVKTARTVLYTTSGKQRPELRNALSAPLFLQTRAKPLPCDVLAAEEDNNISVKGVEFDKIDTLAAIPACRTDLARFPNNPRLMHNLARALDKAGQDVEAVQLYRRAAEMGFDWSQNNLAVMLIRGEGTGIDLKEAMVWWRRAYAQGLRQAAIEYTETDLAEIFAGNAAHPPSPRMTAALQTALKRTGAATLPVSRTFDDPTRAALAAFKAKEGLPGPGVSWQVIDRLAAIDEIFVLRRAP